MELPAGDDPRIGRLNFMICRLSCATFGTSLFLLVSRISSMLQANAVKYALNTLQGSFSLKVHSEKYPVNFPDKTQTDGKPGKYNK